MLQLTVFSSVLGKLCSGNNRLERFLRAIQRSKQLEGVLQVLPFVFTEIPGAKPLSGGALWVWPGSRAGGGERHY